ncbi:MAG: DUF47 domain-containing protein [Candidatus Hodarchaeales archaeon]
MSKEKFSLLTWFRDRRASKIAEKSFNHISKVIDTCNEFFNAMIALTDENSSKLDKEHSEAALNRVILQERSADHIKQELFKEISRVRLDSKIREDLFKLTYQIDGIANWSKVAAKNAIILMELNLELPIDLWARFRTIAEMTLASARLVRKMIESLGVDDETVLNMRTEVETLETSVDDYYFLSKKAIIIADLPAKSMKLAFDLLEGLENSSDHCAGSADIMYILLMASR